MRFPVRTAVLLALAALAACRIEERSSSSSRVGADSAEYVKRVLLK